MGTDAEFSALLSAVSAGRIVPVVDSVIPLAEGRKAYERMQGSAGLGKIVVKVSA
jgi:D-arabinose 1-dehydrogenase-like Zn-dependent alcohol dehydrogenase